ncbi:hypothetical protein DERF_009203 [Dermatophagoides farinae]|uniref:Uncharacterized protein n=1 Tax=Dermatophagoides farinae TaxID=6954 RepID=A0A922HWT0_DERFA|nr:hypothetical protein DERF_009203 [Dermatophagoides farinae]
MSSIQLYRFIVFWATFISITSAIDSSSDDTSLSSTTAVPLLSSSGSSLASTTVYSTPKASSYRSNHHQQEQKKPWPIQSGPINYYQLVKSYNYPSPLPATSKSSPSQSSSISSLMSNIFSPFNKVMSRRVAGGKLFSLVDQFNSHGNSNNVLANAAAAAAAGSGLEYPGSVGNIEALNEAVNNVMMGLNGLQPNQANQLAGQLGSYLSAAAAASGIDASTKNGKKLFDFPKQWYKLLNEKLSGASEAAYSATVPLKESLMNTVKSFYSYIKPSRSQSSSPFGDATSMIAEAAAAAASQDSLMTAAQNSLTSGQNQNNPKRRQSDSYSGYYYNNINHPGKMIATSQQQHYQQAYAPQQLPSAAAYQQYSNGRYASHNGEYSPQSSLGYSNVKAQPTHQTSPVKSINGEMIVMESQVSPSTVHNLKKQYIQYMGKQPIAATMNQPVFQMPTQSSSSSSEQQQSAAKYDQMLSQMIQQSIKQSQQQLLNTNSPVSSASTPAAAIGSKHPNALYQKSKEIISRFTKKRIPSQSLQSQQQYAAATYNSIPMMNEYGVFGQRLPSQTIAKVANKLPSLPLVYNSNSQQQQQRQQQQKTTSQQNTKQLQFSQQQQQSNRIESTQSLPSSVESQQQSKAKNSQHSYYTQQPMNQSPYGIQPVYPPPQQQQQQHTSPQVIPSSSSTVSPMITSTSVSISMHHSISSQYDDHDAGDQYGDNMEQQQQVQYQPPSSTNIDHLKSYLDVNNQNSNTGSDISVQNNQGSVYYYYDQPQQYQQQQQQQQQTTPTTIRSTIIITTTATISTIGFTRCTTKKEMNE